MWEALLFLEPCVGGGVARHTRNTTGNTAAPDATASNSCGGYGPRFKELEELIRRRVAAQTFGQVGRDADSKQVRRAEGGGGEGKGGRGGARRVGRRREVRRDREVEVRRGREGRRAGAGR